MNRSELKNIVDVFDDAYQNPFYAQCADTYIKTYCKLTDMSKFIYHMSISIVDILETIDKFNSLAFEEQVALCLHTHYTPYNSSQYLNKKYAKFYDIINHVSGWLPTRIAFAIITRDISNFDINIIFHEIAKNKMMNTHVGLINTYLNMIS